MQHQRNIAAVVAVGLVGAVLTGSPISSASPPVPANTGSVVESAVATLEREIPTMMAEASIVGATVALVDGDRVLIARGFGWADRARRRPVTARTLFHIGSVSKTFTAISVMQLVEQGRVDLDAPLTRYVPELGLLPRFKGNTITVRSVLDHHSGIPGDVFYGLITMKRPDPGFHDWLLRALRRMPPERRVNTGWAYNNSGYVLLQLLVENVTGQPYAQRTARTVFRRMGMTSSTFDDTRPPSRRLTRNYSRVVGADGRPTGELQADPREYVNGWTAGSIVSNARDMAGYLRMILRRGAGDRGRVLQAKTLQRMIRPQTYLPVDFGRRIGLSWFVGRGWMGTIFGHDGATTRNFSTLTVHPGERLGVFVSTNTVGGSAVADAIADRALQLLYTAKTGVPRPTPVVLPTPPARTPSARELARAQGRYAGYTDFMAVDVDGANLVMRPYRAGQPISSVRFTAMRGGWWRTEVDSNLQIRFRNIGGKRYLLYRNGGGPTMVRGVLGKRMPLIEPGRIWRRAAGRYVTSLDASHATDLVAPAVRLRVSRGSAVLQLGDPPSEQHVLAPVQRRRAFTYGWSGSGGRRKGDIVRIGNDTLTYLGVTYRRTR